MGQEQSNESTTNPIKPDHIFGWLNHLQVQVENNNDGQRQKKSKDKFPTFDEHIATIRALKALCEPSKKTQKPDKLAITAARLPPLLRDDALSYLTQEERRRVLNALEKYFTCLFNNRVALNRKYEEELAQVKRREERIANEGHVLTDAFYESNVINHWETFRDESFAKFGLSQYEQQNILALWEELGNRGTSKEFTHKVGCSKHCFYPRS